MARMKDDEVRFRNAVADIQQKGQTVDPVQVGKSLDIDPSRSALLYRQMQPPKAARAWVRDSKKKGRFLPRNATPAPIAPLAPVVSGPVTPPPVVKQDAQPADKDAKATP